MRLFAVLCLGLSPVLGGFFLSRQQACVPEELMGMIRLVEHIRYEISSFLTKQSELFLRFEDRALARCGFLDTLRLSASQSGNRALYRALLAAKEGLHLPSEAFGVLLEYAERLGEYDVQGEVERAEKTEQALHRHLEQARGEGAARQTLYRWFGVLTGLLVFILLW